MATLTRKKAAAADSPFQQIHRLVRRIPRGRVMSYGQIAGLLSRPLSARAVGWAMRQCPEGLPWHRVVNAKGACSSDQVPGSTPGLQRALLEAEGVTFDSGGRLDIERLRWSPGRRRQQTQ